MIRYLQKDKMTSRLVWEHVQGDIIPSFHGCIVFDDSVLDKNHSHSIDMVHRQYSGNAHSLIKEIGMVIALYDNPQTQQYWIVVLCIFDPVGDGKSKLMHAREILLALIADMALAFNCVLMDSWYATKDLMLLIESLGKLYYWGLLKSPVSSLRRMPESIKINDLDSRLHRNDSFLEVPYCPLKSNRLVDDSGGELAYRRVDELT